MRFLVGASSPLRMCLETGAFLRDFVSPRLHLRRVLPPGPAGCCCQLARSWYRFNPLPAGADAQCLPAAPIWCGGGRDVVSAHKMSQRCAQHRALRAAPGVLHSEGQASFCVGKFVCLPGSPVPPAVACALQHEPLLSYQHPLTGEHGSAAASAFAAGLSRGSGPDLRRRRGLMSPVLEPERVGAVYGRHAWRTVSVLCSSRSTFIPKRTFPG